MKETKKKLILKDTNVIVCNGIKKMTVEGKIIGSEVLYHIPFDMVREEYVCVESFYFGIFDEGNREMEEWWKWLHGLECFPERNILNKEYPIQLKPKDSQYEDFGFTMIFVAEVRI